MEGTGYTDRANSKELVDLAHYLEGIYMGKGNIRPLGRVHIDNLWKVIKEIRQRESR